VQLDVLTLFPEWFDWFHTQRHVRNALQHGHEVRTFNPRAYTPLSGGQVDDTPFGGGAGMVLRVDVMDHALRGIYNRDPVDLRHERRVIALTPGGRMLDDAFVDELAEEPAITLLCGRYEGFDERIVQHFASDAVSVGRYVLSGGELAAMVVMDAVLRKLPGALGHAESALEESFSQALGGDPEYPHYTRPADYRGWKVPAVLLSGHHQEISTWRRLRSRERGAAGPTAHPPDPERATIRETTPPADAGRPGRAAPAAGPDPFGPMSGGGASGGGPDPFGPIGE
jgi:tRNA (guanine37-N1)-methyltransferase